MIEDYVLIYEHCSCIHEMLKEIDYWLKMQSSGYHSENFSILTSAFGGKKEAMARDSDGLLRKSKAVDLLNFNDEQSETKEDQI